MFNMIEHGPAAPFAANYTHANICGCLNLIGCSNNLATTNLENGGAYVAAGKVKVLYYQQAAVAFWRCSCLQAMSKAANPNKPKKQETEARCPT